MKVPKQEQETHVVNWCLGCGSANDKAFPACPKCGSRRHRAYLKLEEAAMFQKMRMVKA